MILSSLYCKAQVIMSIEEYAKYNNSPEEGQFPDYVKDINGTFNKYLGTWKVVDDNKTYEFIVTKVTSSFDMHVRMFKYDALLVRYKITDSNGTVLVDTRSFADDNPFVIYGLVFTEEGDYKLSFRGIDNNIQNQGNILLRVYNGQLRFLFYPEPKVIFGNPTNYFPNKPYTFPREKSIYLTKQ